MKMSWLLVMLILFVPAVKAQSLFDKPHFMAASGSHRYAPNPYEEKKPDVIKEPCVETGFIAHNGCGFIAREWKQYIHNKYIRPLWRVPANIKVGGHRPKVGG